MEENNHEGSELESAKSVLTFESAIVIPLSTAKFDATALELYIHAGNWLDMFNNDDAFDESRESDCIFDEKTLEL